MSSPPGYYDPREYAETPSELAREVLSDEERREWERREPKAKRRRLALYEAHAARRRRHDA